MLYIVATPIGNLEDITLRAIRTLKEADFVICEDTRHTGILMQRYEIKTPMLSFHAHSPDSQLQKLLVLLREGKNLAQVSDAGLPGISDPGYKLIKSAVENGIEVTVIPGASAATTAVVASGLPAHRFLYLGFLPIKKGRQTLLKSLAELPYTLVFYEAPHRILKTLTQIKEFLGDRRVAVCREMTKKFEEFFRGTVSEALLHFEAKKTLGEFTIVVAPPSNNHSDIISADENE